MEYRIKNLTSFEYIQYVFAKISVKKCKKEIEWQFRKKKEQKNRWAEQ